MKTPMPAAAIPQDEATRLRSLAALNVLDSAPEPEFDALVKAAALVCGVPISLISLVDAERQWFKASIGLAGLHEVPREIGFCAHSILDQDLLEIEDASRDPRFAANPLVTGAPGIRFYAGAPLNLLDGTCVGSLCVIDHQPRRLDSTQREILLHLAASARATGGTPSA
jgi:GAF domain-containing protein